MTEYQQGVYDAYNNVSIIISDAIRNNGGATNALQIINVFNEITSHVHYKLESFKNEAENQPEQSNTLEEELDVISVIGEELTSLLRDFASTRGGGR